MQQHIHQVRTFFFMKALQATCKPSEIPDKLNNSATAISIRAGKHRRHYASNRLPGEQPVLQSDMELLFFAVQNIMEELIPFEHRLAPVIMDHTHCHAVIGSTGARAGQASTIAVIRVDREASAADCTVT